MISFREWRPSRPVETRSYTSAIVNAVEASAAGTGGGVAVATAALETAAGLWSRGLAGASVAPRTRRTAPLTPSLLGLIGRALCRHGEVVFDLQVSGGSLTMLPASSAHITTGTGDRRTWIYSLTVDGPGSTVTAYRGRDHVAHLQYAVDPARPWLGRPPWASASLSGNLLAGIERQLAGEAGSASGYILPTPDVGDRGQEGADAPEEHDPLVTLRRDLAAAGGRTVLAPTTAAGFGGGPGAAPAKDYKPERFGFNPPETAVETRRDVERSILAACGVPPVLTNHAAPGTSMREGFRQLTVGTIEPIAALIGDQLSEALGEQIKLTIPRSADVATLARAMQSLTGAGMSIDQAREVVGL